MTEHCPLEGNAPSFPITKRYVYAGAVTKRLGFLERRNKTLALVLGGGITPLGTLRALAALHLPVFCHTNAGDLVTNSRFFSPAPLASGTSDLATLLTSTTIRDAVLFPCSDGWVRQVCALPAELRIRFPASVPTLEVADKFLDKDSFRALLEQFAIPHPRTIQLNSEADFQNIDQAHFDEMFIKPRDSQSFFSRVGVKAWRTRSLDEARKRFLEAQQFGLSVVLQQYVQGPAHNHLFIDGFIDRERSIRALFARTRLRIYPPDFGNSTFMKSISLADVPQAIDSVQRLLPAAGYRGIFSAEFKKDERDGVYRILEVNIRPWWYVGFAVNCGVNVIDLAYRDALGLPVPKVDKYPVGKNCIYPYYDYACLRESGQFNLISWLKDLWGAQQPVFCWRDPWPAAVATVKTMKIRKSNRG